MPDDVDFGLAGSVAASVVDMGIESSNGRAVLSIEVESPIERLAASLFAHDAVDVAWRRSFDLARTDDPRIWRVTWTLDPALPPLLEIGNVSTGGETIGPIEISPTRWVFIKPDSAEGKWVGGEPALADLANVESLREQLFAEALVAPGASQDSPEFLLVAIADNLLITKVQRVPGISLQPVQTVLGEDVRSVLNRFLRERGVIWPCLPRRAWLARMRDDRPAVRVECRIRAVDSQAAVAFGRPVIKQLLDMMTLRRGAAARLIAGVVLGPGRSPGRKELQDAWIEHSGYNENLLGGNLSGEDMHALQKLWSGLQSNQRAQLWVSLYADAVRDPRWDYQIFRYFSLLEAIADTVVPRNSPILDAAGNPRLMPNKKKESFTTSRKRGKVYALLIHLASVISHTPDSFTSFNSAQKSSMTPEDKLWEEVGIWTEIRNDVGHEGAWQPVGQQETPGHAEARAGICARGQDGSFDLGAQAVTRSAREAVKLALFAAIGGALERSIEFGT